VIRGDPLHCRQDHVSCTIRGLFRSSALKGYAQALRLSFRLFCQSYEDLFACRFSVKSGYFSKSRVHRGSCRIKVRRLFEEAAFTFRYRNFALSEERFSLPECHLP
jgi:hypothetical protein